MKLASTFLTSPCSIRYLGWAPCGRINGVCAPSFVSVRTSIADDKNKPVFKSGVLGKHSTGTRPMTTMVDILRNLSTDKRPACQTLNTYSPGWCGEVRDVKYSDNGRVTVVYRVTMVGTDGEAHREGIGTIALNDDRYKDPEAQAEEIAFAKAWARFGWDLNAAN